METLRLLVLAAYDRMIGLELDHLSADGCITKAPLRRRVRWQEPRRPSETRHQTLAVDGWARHTAGHRPGASQHPRPHAATRRPRPLRRPGSGPGTAVRAPTTAWSTRTWRPEGSAVRSPSAARRPPTRLSDGGWWNARTPGCTTSASSVAVPSDEEPQSRSSSPWPAPSSPSAACSDAPGPSTAGAPAHETLAFDDLLADALMCTVQRREALLDQLSARSGRAQASACQSRAVPRAPAWLL